MCQFDYIGCMFVILRTDFEAGVRYTLSVYACTSGVSQLLQRNEGYVEEKGKTLSTSVWRDEDENDLLAADY